MLDDGEVLLEAMADCESMRRLMFTGRRLGDDRGDLSSLIERKQTNDFIERFQLLQQAVYLLQLLLQVNHNIQFQLSYYTE